jgi:hypothetical protein
MKFDRLFFQKLGFLIITTILFSIVGPTNKSYANTNNINNPITTIKTNEANPSKLPINTPSINYNVFNNDLIIKLWLNANTGTTDNLETINKAQITALDISFFRAEGNVKKKKKTSNFDHHVDPGQSGSYDGYGLVNAGGFSNNCFRDRNRDQFVSKVCQILFQKSKTNRTKVGAMSNQARRKYYIKYRFGLYLTKFHLISFKREGKIILQELDSNGLSNISTTEKIYFLDQLNQLGMSRTRKLIEVYKQVILLNKQEVLNRMESLGIATYDGYIYTAGGQKISIDNTPLPIIKLAVAKVIFHNQGTLDNFVPNVTWLEPTSKRWTYLQLTREYPQLNNYIIKALKKQNSKTSINNLQFHAKKINNYFQIEVKTRSNKVIYTSQITSKYNIGFNQVDVPFLDALRRLTQIPQTEAQSNDLIKEAPEIVKNINKR